MRRKRCVVQNQGIKLNENAFPSYRIHRHWSLTCSKTLHRKELLKLSYPALQFTIKQEENENLQKSETSISEDVSALTKIKVKVAVKAKSLSCWIFENVRNENG